MALASGKHRGRTFEEVAAIDAGYCRWILAIASPPRALLEFQNFLKAAADPDPWEAHRGLCWSSVDELELCTQQWRQAAAPAKEAARSGPSRSQDRSPPSLGAPLGPRVDWLVNECLTAKAGIPFTVVL